MLCILSSPITVFGFGGPPKWTEAGEHKKYPKSDFITAVGTGSNREQSDNAAYAALSNYFRASIESQSKDWSKSFSKVSSSGENVNVESQNVEILTKVTTKKIFSGVELTDRAEDDGTHYTLAVLNKQTTATLLSQKITDLDKEIASLMGRADQTESKLEKFKGYGKALILAQEREALNGELLLVKGGKGIPSKYSTADIAGLFGDASANLSVSVTVEGEHSERVKECLTSKLTEKGMQINFEEPKPAEPSQDETAEGSETTEAQPASIPDVLLKGKVAFEPAGQLGSSKMVRVQFDLSLVDPKRNKTVKSWSKYRKEGRPTVPASVALGSFKLCEEVIPELISQIDSYFK